MSCRELDRSDPLVYVRRTRGGGVNGVIYNWDYYLMASLPTNDNVRYSIPDQQEDTGSVPLHEIGNNRYENMVCKSTHQAYRIGGYSLDGPIGTGEGTTAVEKLQENTDNGCVLLLVSSNNFYQRMPECWPWSCRRWTKEIIGTKDNTGKETKTDYYYTQDTNGNKVSVTSVSVPIFSLSLKDFKGNSYGKSYPVYKVTKNTYSGDPKEPETMIGSVYYKSDPFITKTGDSVISADEAKLCNCPTNTQQVWMMAEVFPVLCRGVCKLVIKAGYGCKTKDGQQSTGRSGKILISPFWSCRINESFEILADLNKTGIRTVIGSVTATLNGTDYANQESFGAAGNGPLVVTGADYYIDKVNGVSTQVLWNICDKPKSIVYYEKESGENFGKANTYLSTDDCCKYCKSADQDGNITFSNNLYCSALDKECDGNTYADISDPCSGSSGGGSTGGGGGTTVPGAGGGDIIGPGGSATGGSSTGGLGTSSGGSGGGLGVTGG